MTRVTPLAATVVLAAVIATSAAGAKGGSLDPTFGGDGSVTVDVAARESIWSVSVQPDGKIVAGGGAADGTGRSFWGLLVRLNSDGTRDATFDGDGYVESALAAYTGAIALQRDGKIVYAGGNMRFDGTGTEFAIARYNADGSLDASFGTGGRVTTDFEGGADMARAVLVQPDGRIVVAGQTIVGNNSNLGLVRYLSDGRLDTSFGGDGTVVTDLGAWDVTSELALAPDGKLLLSVIEQEPSASSGRIGAVRFTRTGDLDKTFAGDGSVITDRMAFNSVGLALQPDGRIVLSGGRGLTVLRFTADGRPDRSFGGDGIAEAKRDGSVVAADVALQANGKIVLLGAVDAVGMPTRDFIAARFLPTGAVDPAFSRAAADAGGSEWPFTAAVAPDGRIVGAGMLIRGGSYETDAALVRYLPGTCSVPALRGLTLTSARARLVAGNCRLGSVRIVASKAAAKGRVVRQSLPAGREARDWAVVDVAVSRADAGAQAGSAVVTKVRLGTPALRAARAQ